MSKIAQQQKLTNQRSEPDFCWLLRSRCCLFYLKNKQILNNYYYKLK